MTKTSGLPLLAFKQDDPKPNEASLLEQLAQLRLVTDGLPALVSYVDKDCRYQFVNKTYSQWFGHTLEDIRGKYVWEVLGEAAYEAAKPDVDKVLAGERVDFERHIPYKDGGTRFVQASYLPDKDAEGEVKGYFALITDITERKRTEEALRVSEEKYRTLFDSVDEGFCVFEMLFDEVGRPYNYRFLEVNKKFEEQTGLKDATGKTAKELVPGLEAHWVEIYGKIALTGESLRFEQGSDIMGKWFDVYGTRVGGEGSRSVALLFRDVSERKRRERNLAFLAELQDDFAKLNDAETIMQTVGEKLGSFLNVPYCHFMAIDEANDEVIYLHRWNRDGVLRLPHKVQLSEHITDEFRQLAHAGKTVASNDTGLNPVTKGEANAAIGAVAFVTVPFLKGDEWAYQFSVHDITPRAWRKDEIELVTEIANRVFPRLEKALAEQDLRASEEKYRALTELSSHMVWTLSPKGKVTYLSQKWFDYTGVSQEEVNAGGWLEAVHPDDKERITHEFQIALAKGETYTMELRLRNKAGAYCWHLSRATPVKEGNTILRWLGVTFDIHERKRAEERLKLLSEAGSFLASSLDLEVTLANAAATLVPQFADWCVIDLVADDGTIQAATFAHADPEKIRWAKELRERYPVDLEASAGTPQVIRTGQSEFYPEISDALLQAVAKNDEQLALLRSVGYSSAMVVPLKVRDRTIGAVTLVMTESGRHFGQEDLLVAEELARRWAAAIDNARLHETVKKNEVQLRVVTDAMPALVSYIDTSLRYRLVNQAYKAWFGQTRSDILGKTMPEVLGEAAFERLRPHVEAVLTGRTETFESEVPYRFGGTRFIHAIYTPDLNGNTVNGFFVHVLDITERKRQEQELGKANQRTDLAIEAGQLGLWEWDLTTNEIEWGGQHAVLYGFPLGTHKVQARDLEGLVPEEDLQRVNERIGAAIRERSSFENEYRVRRKDTGELRWMYAKGQVVFEAGEASKLMGTLQDITERKKLEQDLREADRRKDEFLAVLAHELRNPLAPIRMSLEVMKRTTNKQVEAEAKGVIERQTNQLVALVDDLLDVSRITQGRIKLNKEKVDLREVVNMALESTHPLMEERGHDVQVLLPPEKTLLEVDKTRLAQVLLNLLNNAAKYTSPGGKITLSAKLENAQVVIRVKDTGYGIPEEKLPHIFELFGRLERDVSREGLGIGLSIVKQLVELHGGRIEAKSPGLNQGSEFTVRLPFVETALEDVQHSPMISVASKEQHKVRCVLVVDDYEPNRRTMARLVQLMGHEVVTAGSGEEGLEALKHFKADLILCDLNMPGMNGFEVARLIRGNPPEHPFKLVALTGYGQENDIKRSKEAGFDAHVVKPVGTEVLEQLLYGEENLD